MYLLVDGTRNLHQKKLKRERYKQKKLLAYFKDNKTNRLLNHEKYINFVCTNQDQWHLESSVYVHCTMHSTIYILTAVARSQS